MKDLAEARRYIGRDDPAAARRVVLRIIEAVDRLADTPKAGRPGRMSGTRELVIRGYPSKKHGRGGQVMTGASSAV